MICHMIISSISNNPNIGPSLACLATRNSERLQILANSIKNLKLKGVRDVSSKGKVEIKGDILSATIHTYKNAKHTPLHLLHPQNC